MMDYKALGMKAGLEIHQQLNSGTKLFCRCPVGKSESFNIELHRKMNPVQSELGEEDPAALFEYFRNRTFVYKADTNTSCLVEMDENPPLPVSEKALHTALQISKMLGCSLVDEVYFMRKAVIDGSAVSGFQRTGLIATNGSIETSFGTVKIETVNLEEDSAPAVGKGAITEYRLDRLGIPLVEIATDASMRTPDQVKEVAEKIGTLLRATDVVRGIGSIRQDVNVSIERGNRVELKGYQELASIPELVENEVKRQLALVEIKDELQKRGFSPIGYDNKDVTQLFKSTKCNFVKKAIDNHQKVFGLKIPKFSGLLARQCGDRTFGKELSAYPASHGLGIIHSDEDLDKYSLSLDFANLRKELHAEEQDLVLIMAGSRPEKAIKALIDRINYCAVGVPPETRVADGIGSKYARPLPGAGRLYPESDVPAIKVTRSMREIAVPKTLEERKDDFKELPDDMKDQIIRSVYYAPTMVLKQYGERLAANLFLSNYKEVSRKGFDVSKIKHEDLHILLKSVSSGSIPQNKITDILIELCSGAELNKILEKYSLVSDDKLEHIVKSVIHDNPGKSDSALIGIVMSKAKADGRCVSELIKKFRR